MAACLLVLLPGCSARQPAADAGPRPDSLRSQALGTGVTHEFRWYASGPWAVHELIIDPKACVVLRTAKAQAGRETTSSMASRLASTTGLELLGAINADFFSYNPAGVSEGPQVSAGTLIKGEGTHREAIEDRGLRLQPVFAVTADRKGTVGYTRTRGTLRSNGVQLALGGVNVQTRAGAAFVFDTMWQAVTPADTGALEIIVREVQSSGYGQRRGVVVGIDTSAAGVAVPAGGFVVSLRDSARISMARVSVGDSVFVSVRFENLPANVVELVGGYPMLLLRGKPVFNDEAGLRVTFSDRRHPRSAIGVSPGGRIHIVAVDGRHAGYSEGMSLQELAEYMVRRGVPDVLNFDGGGSTTLLIRNRIANRPSDTNGERAVSNALVVLEASRCDSR